MFLTVTPFEAFMEIAGIILFAGIISLCVVNIVETVVRKAKEYGQDSGRGTF